MTTTTDADTLPPPVLSHGGRVLTLTVRHQAGVSKRTGEIRFRTVRKVYFVQRVTDASGKIVVVQLTNEAGETYDVRPHGCTCPAWRFRAHQFRVACLHVEACRALKLFNQPQEAQR